MRKATPITCLFVDVGGVLLTDGWDHRARKRAAMSFKLDWAEMEQRHLLMFQTYEEGKLTLEEYLDRLVFYQKRTFTRAQFRRFMFSNSRPYPEMIEMVAGLKARHGLRVGVVNNEARELNAYRRRSDLAALWTSLFPLALSTSASPMPRSSAWRWILPRCGPGRSFTSKTPRCSRRSRKVWVCDAWFTRVAQLHAQSCRNSDYPSSNQQPLRRGLRRRRLARPLLVLLANLRFHLIVHSVVYIALRVPRVEDVNASLRGGLSNFW